MSHHRKKIKKTQIFLDSFRRWKNWHFRLQGNRLKWQSTERLRVSFDLWSRAGRVLPNWDFLNKVRFIFLLVLILASSLGKQIPFFRRVSRTRWKFKVETSTGKTESKNHFKLNVNWNWKRELSIYANCTPINSIHPKFREVTNTLETSSVCSLFFLPAFFKCPKVMQKKVEFCKKKLVLHLEIISDRVVAIVLV